MRIHASAMTNEDYDVSLDQSNTLETSTILWLIYCLDAVVIIMLMIIVAYILYDDNCHCNDNIYIYTYNDDYDYTVWT